MPNGPAAPKGERKIEPVVAEALRRTGYNPPPESKRHLFTDAEAVRMGLNKFKQDPQTIVELNALWRHGDGHQPAAGAVEYLETLVKLVTSGWTPERRPGPNAGVDLDWI